MSKLYHATFNDYVPSIMRNGLIPNFYQNWVFSDSYVYLGIDAYQCQSYLEESDAPDEFFENGIAILEIDTDMLDKNKLTVDENNLDGDTFQYEGIIIPAAITVKSVVTAF